MKTKAAVLVAQNAPLEIMELEIPPLDVGQVLVRVAYSGICGKQIDEITGRRGPDPHLPHLLGHEGSGVVEEVGPGVRKVKPGDRVVLHWMKGSGIDSLPPRYRRNGTVVSAGWVTTFNEWAVVSENRLTPIGADLPLDVAALLGCAVTTGLGIVFNDLDLRPGDTIVVFGVGGVGLNVVHGAGLVNACPIVAVDLHEGRLNRARTFGATHAVRANRPELPGLLTEISSGKGFDASVDTTGARAVRETAYQVTGHAGRMVLAGVPNHTDGMTIDSFPLHFGRRISGSHGGGTRPDRDIPRYLNLYRQGRLELEGQITHQIPLERVGDALELVVGGETGRCVLAL